jgi:hypothetical protein
MCAAGSTRAPTITPSLLLATSVDLLLTLCFQPTSPLTNVGTPFPEYESWKPVGVEGKEPFLPVGFWVQHGPKPGCAIGASPNAQIIFP